MVAAAMLKNQKIAISQRSLALLTCPSIDSCLLSVLRAVVQHTLDPYAEAFL